ncbi:unnamed protein product [Moneuplotes crassus]|uniref:Uncharacterized protein n=1 Tax=Euplotes crassus TaxID=5936 RepID=A0AAD1XGW7_EUPCR|nr:unnamed protein product [Moneuplotes crassus]
MQRLLSNDCLDSSSLIIRRISQKIIEISNEFQVNNKFCYQILDDYKKHKSFDSIFSVIMHRYLKPESVIIELSTLQI